MSLDVWLLSPIEKEKNCHCCGYSHMEHENLFDANITHNLGEMAEKAGIYKHLWHPEDIDITVAAQLIEPLTKGLQDLKDRPEFFKQYDANNGWGTYKDFVPWVEKYLNACIENPDATIHISR